MARLLAEGNDNHEVYKTIASTVPISLRGSGHTSADVMCDYVSSCSISTPMEQAQFAWVNAAALAIELKVQVQKCPENVGVLKYLFGKERAFFRGLEGKKRNAGLELSNIGKFDASTGSNDKWRITQIVFAQCDAVGGSAIKVNVAGDPDGGLSLAVTWREESIESQFVESFIYQFRRVFWINSNGMIVRR